MIVNESGDVFGDQVYFGTGAYDLVIRIKTQWSRSRPGFGFLAFPCISCFSWLKCISYLIVFWSFGISSAFMVRSNCSIEILGCWCDFSMICDLCPMIFLKAFKQMTLSTLSACWEVTTIFFLGFWAAKRRGLDLQLGLIRLDVALVQACSCPGSCSWSGSCSGYCSGTIAAVFALAALALDIALALLLLFLLLLLPF